MISNQRRLKIIPNAVQSGLSKNFYLKQLNISEAPAKASIEKVMNYIAQNDSKSPDNNLLLKGKESYYLIKNLIKQIGTK